MSLNILVLHPVLTDQLRRRNQRLRDVHLRIDLLRVNPYFQSHKIRGNRLHHGMNGLDLVIGGLQHLRHLPRRVLPIRRPQNRTLNPRLPLLCQLSVCKDLRIILQTRRANERLHE